MTLLLKFLAQSLNFSLRSLKSGILGFDFREKPFTALAIVHDQVPIF